MDRGGKYYEPTGETTEWEDILIKKGIMEPKNVPVTEEEEEEEDEINPIENATLDELDEMSDEYDDDKELERIRAKRIAEMREQLKRSKYGSIIPIAKQDWNREVNDASKECWVVVYLFDSGVEACNLMDQALLEVARRHKDVKFVSLNSLSCIENWPSRNLPTLFLYRNGELQTQLLTLKKLGGLDMKVEDLEEYLASHGVFKVTQS